MKKIITTVGTSIFTNIFKENQNSSVKEHYKYLEDTSSDEWETEHNTIKELRTSVINEWGKNKKDDSAEIKSILAITNELQEDVEVYLLATDTVLSVLACKLVKEWFNRYSESEYAINIQFNEKHDVMSKLQVNDKDSFNKEGLVNLINRLYSICDNYFTDTVLNITGGYKAVIPYMTIFGQVNQVPVKYIFEDTDTLIEIPLLPLTLDNSLFDKYYMEFSLLEQEILNQKDYYQFAAEAVSCLEIDASGEILYNPLGSMLWETYKSNYFFFCASDEVWNEIQTQEDIKRILRTKFYTVEGRQNKTEKKQSHYVYDDGDNNNRIYYFEVDNQVYIYKTFENEAKAKAFIETSLNKNYEKKKSELRKIEIHT
jgi:CRISPR/Cas system-associated protein Csm6